MTLPVLIFDGTCGFCTSCATWIRTRLRTDATVVPWQTLGERGLAGLGLAVDDVEAAAWWVDLDGSRYGGHRSIAKAMIATGGWRAILGRAMLLRVVSPVAEVIYRLVARNRHRLPGSQCAVGGASAGATRRTPGAKGST